LLPSIEEVLIRDYLILEREIANFSVEDGWHGNCNHEARKDNEESVEEMKSLNFNYHSSINTLYITFDMRELCINSSSYKNAIKYQRCPYGVYLGSDGNWEKLVDIFEESGGRRVVLTGFFSVQTSSFLNILFIVQP